MSSDNTCNNKPIIKDLSTFGGNVDDFFEYLNNFLEDVFFNTKLYLNGKQIEISTKKDSDGKLERFWHIISKTDYSNQSKTYPDLARCNAIHYIPTLLTNCKLCKNWVYFVRKEKNLLKTYIWCLETNIIIVLSNVGQIYRFITCFIVQGKRNIAKYTKRYEDYIEWKKLHKNKNGYSR